MHPFLFWLLIGIGSLLGLILVLAIILLFVVLYVPIKYNIYAEKIDDINGFAKVTWLFRIFSVYVGYKDDLKYSIKIFGRELGKKEDKEKKSKKVESSVELSKVEPQKVEPQKVELKKVESQKIKTPKTKKRKKFNLDSKIKKVKKTYKDLTGKTKKYKKILRKLNNIPNKNKLLRLLKKRLKKILHNIKPKYFNIETEIGLGVYNTGILLAATAVFFPAISPVIQGNFKENIFTVKVSMGGKIRLRKIIIPALFLYIRKDVRKAIEYIQNIIKV